MQVVGSRLAKEFGSSCQVKVCALIKARLGYAKGRESRWLSPAHAQNCSKKAGRFGTGMTESCAKVMSLSNFTEPNPIAAI